MKDLVRVVRGEDVDAPADRPLSLGQHGAAVRGLLQALARAHYGEGAPGEARKLVERALDAVEGPDLEVLSELIFEPHLADEWSTAADLATAILQRQPDLVYARWVRGAALGKLGQLDDALDDLQACLDAPADWLARYADAVHDSLAEIHLQRGEPERALEHAELALKLDPDRTDCLDIKDQALLAMGRADEGEDWIRTALTETSPRSALGQSHLLLRLAERGQYGTVLELGTALMQRIGDGSAGSAVQELVRAVRGEAAETRVGRPMSLGQHGAAVRGLLQALARAHYGEGAPGEARKLVERALDAVEGPDLEVLSELIFEPHLADEWSTAADLATAILQRQPDLVYARWVRGAALGKLGQLDDALDDLQACLDAPADWLARYADAVHDSLAEIHLQRSEPERALEHADRALQLEPAKTQSWQLKLVALQTLGHMAQTRGEAAKALEHAEAVGEIDPGKARELKIQVLLATGYEAHARGETKEALHLAEEVLALDPDQSKGLELEGLVRIAMGYQAHDRGETDEALRCAEAAEPIVPARARELRVQVLLAAGHEAHAGGETEDALRLAEQILALDPDQAEGRVLKASALMATGYRAHAQGETGEALKRAEEVLAIDPARGKDLKIQALYSLAGDRLRRGDPEGALQHVEAALQLDPGLAYCLELRDQALLAMQRLDEGEDWICSVLTDASPRFALNQSHLLLRLCERGRYRTALELGEGLLDRLAGKDAGGNLQALTRVVAGDEIGDSYVPLGDHSAALRSLVQALVRARYGLGHRRKARQLVQRALDAVDGPDLEVLSELIFEPHLADEWRTAVKLATGVLQRQPNLVYARWMRGAARGKLDDLDGALDDLRACLGAPAEQLAPFADAVHDALAEIYLQQEEPELALQHAEQALQLDPAKAQSRQLKVLALQTLGHIAQSQGEAMQALRHADAVGEFDPDRARELRIQVLLSSGYEAHARGESDRALDEAETVLEIDPDRAKGRELKGLALIALGYQAHDLGDAEQALQYAAEADPLDPARALELRVQVLLSQGHEAHAQGEIEHALRLADEVLALDPDHEEGRVLKASALMATGYRAHARGETEQALKRAEEVSDLDPTRGRDLKIQALYTLAGDRLRQGDPERALQHVEAALQIDPEITYCRELRDQALLAMKRLDEGEDWIRSVLTETSPRFALDQSHLLLGLCERGRYRPVLRLGEGLLDRLAGGDAGDALQAIARAIRDGGELVTLGDHDVALRSLVQALARARYGLGHRRKARQLVQRALDAVEGADLEVLCGLIFEPHLADDWATAVAQATGVLQRQPGLVYARWVRGAARGKLDDLDGALDDLRDCLDAPAGQLATFADAVHDSLAEVHLQRQEPELALKHAELALKLDPAKPQSQQLKLVALQTLGHLAQTRGEAAQALLHAEAVGKLDPARARELKIQVLLAAGYEAHARGETEQAQEQAERVLEIDPYQVKGRELKGLALIAHGYQAYDRGETATALGCAVEAEPLAPARSRELKVQVLLTQGHDAHARGETDDALRLAEEVLDLDPEQVEGRVLKASALMATGYQAHARGETEQALRWAAQAEQADPVQARELKIQILLAEGHQAHVTGKTEEALRIAGEVLALDPEQVEGRVLKASALMATGYQAHARGETEQALRWAAQAEQADPVQARELKIQILLAEGHQAHARGETDDTLRLADEVLALEPEQAEGRVLKASALMATGYRAHARGETEQALARAEEVSEIDPSRGRDLKIQALYTLAGDCLRQGDPEGALRHVDEALQIDPKLTYCRELRDQALLAMKRLDEGEDWIRSVLLETSPRFALNQSHLLLSLCERGRYRTAVNLGEGLLGRLVTGEAGDALQAITRAVTGDEAGPITLGDHAAALRSLVQALARARYGLGHRRKAQQLVQRALDAVFDTDLEALSELIFEPHLADDWSTAVALATAALQRRPDLVHARWVRGSARGKLDDLDGALDDLRTCLDAPAAQLAPFASAVHDCLAEVLLQRQEPEMALQHAEQALQLDPARSQSQQLKLVALQTLGHLAQTRGEAAQALLHAEAVGELDPARARELKIQVLLAAGYEAHARGESGLALDQAKQVLEIDPDRAKGRELEGLALIALGYLTHDRGESQQALRWAADAEPFDPARARELRAQVLLAQGHQAHAKGETDDALRLAEEVLTLDPDQAEGRVLKASALMANGYRAHARGETEQALARAEEVSEIDPARGRGLEIQARYTLASERLRQGDPEGALQHVEAALQLDPGLSYCRELKDQALLAMQRLDEGEDWIRSVLTEASPHFALDQSHLLLRLCERGRYRTALDLGEGLLGRLDRDEAGETLQAIARALSSGEAGGTSVTLGDHAAAVRSLVQALARARYGLGHRRKARQLVQRAHDAVEGADLEALSELLIEPHLADDWSTAVALATRFLQRRPDLIYAHWVRGAARGKLDDLDGALVDLRACLDAPASALAQSTHAVHDSLAEVHLQRQEPELALEHAEQALKLDPAKPQSRRLKVLALQTLGHLAQTRGEAMQALRHAEAVGEIDPVRARELKIQVLLAAGYEAHARGESDQALDHAEMVLEIDPDLVKGRELKGLALIALGYQAHDRGESGQALRWATDAQRVDPARARELRVQVLLALGHEAHARGATGDALRLADEVLALDPDQAEGRVLKASSLMAMGYLAHARGETDEALQRAEEASQIDPRRGRDLKLQALYAMASDALEQGDPRHALQHVEAALQLAPDLAYCLELRDRTLLAMKRLDEGESWIRTVLTEATPRFALDQSHLLLSLCQRGRHRTVLELGEALLSRLVEGEGGVALQSLTQAFTEDEAIEGPVALGSHGTGLRGLLQALIRAQYGLGHHRKARQLLLRALDAVTGPDLELLSELLFESHLADEWGTVVEQATGLLDRQPDVAYAHWVRGAARGKLGELDEALADLQACLDAPAAWLTPFADAVHDSLAEVYLLRGEFELALRHADKALEINPTKKESQAIREQALKRLG